MKLRSLALILSLACSCCAAVPQRSKAVEQPATTLAPSDAFIQLTMNLLKRADATRHIIDNPTTPPDVKAVAQARVGALIEAADLAQTFAAYFPPATITPINSGSISRKPVNPSKAHLR